MMESNSKNGKQFYSGKRGTFMFITYNIPWNKMYKTTLKMFKMQSQFSMGDKPNGYSPYLSTFPTSFTLEIPMKFELYSSHTIQKIIENFRF